MLPQFDPPEPARAFQRRALRPSGSKPDVERAAGRLSDVAYRAFLMEIDPAYCDVIVRRWEEFTGRKAEHLALELVT